MQITLEVRKVTVRTPSDFGPKQAHGDPLAPNGLQSAFEKHWISALQLLPEPTSWARTVPTRPTMMMVSKAEENFMTMN